MKFIVDAQSIKFADTSIGVADLVSGTVNCYRAEFQFSEDWEDYTKTAVFLKYDDKDGRYPVGSSYTVLVHESLLLDPYCVIPWETINEPGYLKVGIYGVKGTSTKPTSWTMPIFVDRGTSSAAPTAPTPDIYQEILDDYAEVKEQNDEIQEAMGDIEELNIEDFDNIVDAMNYLNGFITVKRHLDNPLQCFRTYDLSNLTALDANLPIQKKFEPYLGYILVQFSNNTDTAFTGHIRDSLNTIKSGVLMIGDFQFTAAAHRSYQIQIYPVHTSLGDYWDITVASFNLAQPAPIANHKAFFDLQGHGEFIWWQEVKTGYKITRPEDPVEAGYTFGGWYKQAACTNEWNFNIDPMPDNDVTLYAKWTAVEVSDQEA